MSPAGITIDCSRWTHESSGQGSLEDLLRSIRSLSDAAPVHVYLRSTLSGQVPRRYQTLLQSFGCRVTMKMPR